MKTYSAELLEAFELGAVMTVGAVKIATAVNPARVWGGYHSNLELAGETYTGIGDAGLIKVTGGKLGSAEQTIELILSGVDPDLLPILEEIDVRRAPVVIWRLFFDSAGANLLDAHIFARGRVDALPTEDIPGGDAKIICRVETAARGLGRQTGRMRSDADQRLIDGDDGGFQWITQAPSRQLAWGGKPPAHASQVLPNAGQAAAQAFLDRVF